MYQPLHMGFSGDETSKAHSSRSPFITGETHRRIRGATFITGETHVFSDGDQPAEKTPKAPNGLPARVTADRPEGNPFWSNGPTEWGVIPVIRRL